MRDEMRCIERIKRCIPRRLQGVLGIGDDAEILRRPRCAGLDWVVASDVIVEGVDFIPGRVPAEGVGRKALAVNLSDLAAMAAQPYAFAVSLGLPRRWPESWLDRFYRGLISLASDWTVICAGGDLSRAKEFFAAVTVFGLVRRGEAVTRKGANPGDRIAVTGRLGGSISRHHYSFTPRIREAAYLARCFKPSAMIDISDGFVQDLGHILKSSGVAAAIDLDRVPVSANAQRLAKGNRRRALMRALTDGEDFEVLFALPEVRWQALHESWKKSFPRVPLNAVGTVIPGRPGEIRWCRMGQREKSFRLSKTGYRHF